jgi:hypothetical protein
MEAIPAVIRVVEIGTPAKVHRDRPVGDRDGSVDDRPVIADDLERTVGPTRLASAGDRSSRLCSLVSTAGQGLEGAGVGGAGDAEQSGSSIDMNGPRSRCRVFRLDRSRQGRPSFLPSRGISVSQRCHNSCAKQGRPHPRTHADDDGCRRASSLAAQQNAGHAGAPATGTRGHARTG